MGQFLTLPDHTSFLNEYFSNLHGDAILNGVGGVAVGVLMALTIIISTRKVYNAGTEKMNTLHQLELSAPRLNPRPSNLRDVDVLNTTPFNLPVESRGNHCYPSQKECSTILGVILGSLYKQMLATRRQRWLWNTPASVASTALIVFGLSYLPRVAAQTDSPAYRINSSLPTGVVTLVGVLALGFNAWLQGGIDAAPQVVRATRYIFSLKTLSGLDVNLSSESSNTFFTVFSFAHKHLTSFVLDTAQRGFFHRKYCALVGTKGAQEIPLDVLPSKKLGCPTTGCQSTKKCRNTSFVTKLPLPAVARYNILIPDAQSVALLEGMAGCHDTGKLHSMPLFLVQGCILPLRSLVYLPLRFWIDPEVLTEDEFIELIALHLRCSMDCFSTLRQWFSGADIWDWVTTLESSDASYTVARALECNDSFRFEQHDPTIPWPSKDGLTCLPCERAARKDRATASLAMFKVAFWFTRYALYHEAFYHDGVVMRGDKNATAADLVLEILNNGAATMQHTNSAVLTYLSRTGTFLEFPGYPLSIEHAASIAEIVAAFILSMVADPGIWVAATVARQITVRVLVSESGRGLPMAQRWGWCCLGRFPIFDTPKTQGIAVWNYSRYNSWGAVFYGWLAVAAALAGTRLRSQAAQLQWCTNFEIHLWVGWVAYSAVVLIVLVSLVLSLLGPSRSNTSKHKARAGPLAAEVTLLQLTPWKVARLFGMAAAIVSGALVLVYPSMRWLGYLPEVASMVLWFGSEEYTYSSGYSGSATAVAILVSGLAGISRGFQLKVPFSCSTVVG
jgi:hypothetical protein